MSKRPTIYTVVEIVQTSSFWPNQFEGRFSDGDYLYIRVKDSLFISKSPTAEGMASDYFYLMGCDMPDGMGAGHDLTIEQLIAFCKIKKLPIKFNELRG